MSQPNVDVDVDQAATATKRFEPATDQIHTTVTELSYVRYSQTEDKWGVRPAPDFFRQRYTGLLDKRMAELEDMQRQLETFIAEVRRALQRFQDNESDQEVAAMLAAERLEELSKDEAETVEGGYGALTADQNTRDAATARFIRGLARPV